MAILWRTKPILACVHYMYAMWVLLIHPLLWDLSKYENLIYGLFLLHINFPFIRFTNLFIIYVYIYT